MHERRPSAGELLIRARHLFDNPGNSLALSARGAWRRGFTSGGQWMAAALQVIRQESSPRSSAHLQSLGVAKYAIAGAAGMVFVLSGFLIHQPLIGLLGVIAFYAAEAQMVFLFPLALDGHHQVFRESRRWTLRIGGTLAMMRVVLPVAATMIFGGFFGRGFLRSWCLGCLAICIWYEDLRRQSSIEPVPRASRFQFGAFAPLHIRREQIELGLTRPATLLYASDLHLGWWWTNPVVARLVSAVKSCAPDAIILGGDLVDRRRALPLLRDLAAELAKFAPVYAIAGNHDNRLGAHAVRAAVEAGGAIWMDDAPGRDLIPLRPDLFLGATLDTSNADRSSPVSPAFRPCIRRAAPNRGFLRQRLHLQKSDTAKTAVIRETIKIKQAEAGFRKSNSNSISTPPRHRIFCGHDPAVFPAACAAGYRLVLAGHLHGGQCVLATRNGQLYPGAWLARWTGLRFTRGSSTMLVSRGAADTLPLRWNCPREVIVCELS